MRGLDSRACDGRMGSNPLWRTNFKGIIMKVLKVTKIELKGCEHLEFHHIQFPEYHDDGWYRKMISFGAFFESVKQRNKSKNFLYYLVDDRYDDRQHKLMMEMKFPEIAKYEADRDAKMPVIEHAGLFEFFEYIGYCRKKQKITDK